MSAHSARPSLGAHISLSARIFASDVGRGLLAASHSSLALIGLGVMTGALLLGGRDDLRSTLEEHALDWLQERQDARVGDADDLLLPGDQLAVDRVAAIDPADLPRQQAAVAQWLSKRYRVAPEPIGRLVQEAWTLGQRVGLEPTLILAIMAIESSFNPFAQSAVGAQGLMQVLTRVHDDKYEPFGGNHAAFDPLTNLRVGVQVLKDCIAKAGSIEGGLRHYVGAANLADDGGYAFKVLAEQGFLQQVQRGRAVPATARLPVPPVGAGGTAANTPSPTPTSAPRAAKEVAAKPAAPAVSHTRTASDRVALAEVQ